MRGLCLAVFALVVFGLSLIGCGGSGDNGGTEGPPPTSIPNITINWPERSRNVEAPASAVSVRITMVGAGPNGTDATIVAERDRTTPYSQSYSLPVSVTGSRTMRIRFFSDGPGAIEVSSVTLTVRVDSDGTLRRADGRPLGSITTQTRIVGVVIENNQSVALAADTALNAWGVSATNEVIAIGGGGIFWQLVDTAGPDRMSLSRGGVARGARIGWETVRATVDGITSAPTLVKVGFQRSNIITERNDIIAACDAPGDGIWAVGTEGGLYLLTKGTLFRNPALTTVGDAGAIARSADNHYVYAATTEGIRRWNTWTETLDRTAALDSAILTTRPYAIAVDPTNPLRIAVSYKAVNNDFVVALYDDMVRRNQALVIRDSAIRGLTFSDSGQRILAYTADGRVINLTPSLTGLGDNGNRINGQAFRQAAPYVQTIGTRFYTHNLRAFNIADNTPSTDPEILGVGWGLRSQAGITPRLYSAQIEPGGRANSILIYQDSGAGLQLIAGLDIPLDRLVTDLISADANGFVFMSGDRLVRLNTAN